MAIYRDETTSLPPTDDEASLPIKVPLAQLNLRRLWGDHCRKHGHWDHELFRLKVTSMVSDPENVERMQHCYDCVFPTFDYTELSHGSVVCADCLKAYSSCTHCEELVRYPTQIADDVSVCADCRNDYYTYCEPCGVWYESDDAWEQHNHGGPNCRCESPPAARQFTVRNDGNTPLANDQKVTVVLPSGVISEEGMDQIAYALRTWARSTVTDDPDREAYYVERQKWYDLAHSLDKIGAKWQAKEGNFTKRLSRLAYKEHGIKIPPELLSKVGNIANMHSAGSSYRVAFTRDLNLSPDQFANYDSCWWGSYAASRCALKSNGGFALRTFSGDAVSGRAWVMPLRLVGELPHQAMLVPTFETLQPDAFVVFNAYGEMHGYLPARIMAHLAGMTYRKVAFMADPIYINNESGYLVAPEEIADHYNDGCLDLDIVVHSDLFDREMKEISHVA